MIRRAYDYHLLGFSLEYKLIFGVHYYLGIVYVYKSLMFRQIFTYDRFQDKKRVLVLVIFRCYVIV